MIEFKYSNDLIIYIFKNKKYNIDTENNTCTCKGFYFNGYKKENYKCKHLKIINKIKEFNSKIYKHIHI